MCWGEWRHLISPPPSSFPSPSPSIPAKAGIHASDILKTPCVYILASKPNGTLYIGVTANLVQRVWWHRNDFVEGFTKRYRIHSLVWYEVHDTMESAIGREKAMKKWRRMWKVELIEKANPMWLDLYDGIV